MIGPLSYIGGKRRLAPALVRMLPRHRTYVEPFAGGAQVFFHKAPSAVEVLNDIDGEVVNFYKVCQWHARELTRYLKFSIVSRQLFDIHKRQDPLLLTDVQRAARFLYLQKNCFGGKTEGSGQTYHICVAKPSSFNIERLPKLIERTAARLGKAQLEHRPYEAVLASYDRGDTLFYCDPPYVGVKLYKSNFADDDYFRLAERLTAIRGKFLLSINDHPVAVEAFRRFHRREVHLPYTVSRKVPIRKELVFANFTPPDVASGHRP